MTRIERYLEIVPLPWIIAPTLALILGFIVVPGRLRLFIALAIVPVWLTLARLPDLGTIQAVTKVSSAIPFLLVALSALLHPGPKRHLPGILWLYPALACVSIAYVLGVQEAALALALRVQWIALTLAAVLLARTIVTAEDLMKVVQAITVGCLFAIVLPFSALIAAPGEAFLKGRNRFQPYGVNSNQIGVLFALTVPLATYMAMTTRRVMLKPVLVLAVAVTLGMALITGSRSTMLVICIVMVPILLKLTQRPMMTITAAIVGMAGLTWLFGMAETTALERFGIFDLGRFGIMWEYIDKVISQRPLFGLAGTTGLSAFKAPEVGYHPHNAYLEMLYVGGLSYGLPMIFLAVYSAFCTLAVWRQRSFMGADPLLVSMLCVLLLAMYIQGFANQVVYWPTYTWSMLHVVLASLFISIARDIRTAGPAYALPSERYDASAYDAYGEYGYDEPGYDEPGYDEPGYDESPAVSY